MKWSEYRDQQLNSHRHELVRSGSHLHVIESDRPSDSQGPEEPTTPLAADSLPFALNIFRSGTDSGRWQVDWYAGNWESHGRPAHIFVPSRAAYTLHQALLQTLDDWLAGLEGPPDEQTSAASD